MGAIRLLFCLLVSLPVWADVYVPPALEDWVDWVEDAHPERRCPADQATGSSRRCVWISRLDLNVAEGLQFEMQVRTYSRSRVALPGDARNRPEDVRVAGVPVPVIGEPPAVLLDAGTHTVTGRLSWARRPADIGLPDAVGVLSLNLDGKRVERPVVRGGRLVLGQNAPVAAAEQDTLRVDVFRLLQDGQPMQLTTELVLHVAGMPRVATLGRVLLDGFEVLSVDSPLPARVDAEGNLQVQLAAGEHAVRVTARATRQHTEVAAKSSGNGWPEQEVWGFLPDRQLRLVDAGGAPGIALAQTAWPFDGSAAGFLLGADDRLTLAETQRGDTNPKPNRYSVGRALWLSFDGARYVVHDTLDMDIRAPARLAADYAVGRVEVDGELQLVNTVLGGEPGVAVQQGDVSLAALGTLPAGTEMTAAGGWADATDLRASLQLPPGWRLLWTRGVDRAPDAWLSRWTLWDVFTLVLIAVLAMRFLRLPFAVLATAALVFVLPDHNGVALTWGVGVGLVAVLSRLEHVKARTIVQALAMLWLTGTLLATLTLAVSFAQQAMYPQLEPYGQPAYEEYAVESVQMDSAQDMALPMSPKARSSAPIEEIVVTATRREVPKYREGLRLQTGPGEPEWQWRRVSLEWSGPVSEEQRMSLTLASPLWVRLGHVLAAALALAVVAGLSIALIGPARQRLPVPLRALLPLALLVLAVPVAPPVQAETPAPEVLKELERRLLAPDPCFPQCAGVEHLVIELQRDRLSLGLAVHAAQEVSVPVPSSDVWAPEEILLDGAAAIAARQAEQLHVVVPAGRHVLALRGEVRSLDRFEVRLPLVPAAIDARVDQGWQLSGLSAGRATRGSIGFDRRAQSNAESAETLQPDAAKPFVRVHRQLRFDQEWTVHTVVRREAPAAGGFTVSVPLLPGESVLDGRFEPRDGAVAVVFGPRDGTVAWDSVLSRQTELSLAAADDWSVAERWQVETTNLWHVSHDGVPPLFAEATQGLLFQPRPGETLKLTLSATEPVPGSTVTVEHVAYDIVPGDRAVQHQLVVQMKASEGGTYALELAGVQPVLNAVMIDGDDVPLALNGSRLLLPLVPGDIEYALTWTSDDGLRARQEFATPGFASDAHNVTTTVRMPQDRWVLLLGGPTLGPAMLYWGLALVMVVLALAVARVPGSIVSSADALLLALGLSVCSLPSAVLMLLWVLALAARPALMSRVGDARLKNLLQVSGLLMGVIAVIALVVSVPLALLSSPDMRIEGNGSSSYFYRWFVDVLGEDAHTPWVLSVPLWVYRAAMLGWSLWLAFALIRWVRDAWALYSRDGLWFRRAKPAAEAS